MAGKILFCATVDYHFKAFHLPVMEWFKQQGWEVHVAAKGKLELPFVDRKFDLPFERSPFRPGNVRAYREMKAIIRENRYDFIHCHTPMGGVCARLAARQARSSGTKMLYTAHGFHFCKGGSPLSWAIYYPIEKQLARLTDCLITINKEDYNLAVQKRFKAGKIVHVHGVGVNTARFKPLSHLERWRLRHKLGYRSEDFLMFYAAEFNKNKNHQLLIRALAVLTLRVPDAKLLLAGEGPMLASCRELAVSLGVEKQVQFLGYRSDIAELLPMCDAAVASSLREGLPVNIMEAMACGLPVVATVNRGHSELVVEEENGFLIADNDHELFARRLIQLSESAELRNRMGADSRRHVQSFALLPVKQELSAIYQSLMVEERDEAKSQYHRAYI